MKSMENIHTINAMFDPSGLSSPLALDRVLNSLSDFAGEMDDFVCSLLSSRAGIFELVMTLRYARFEQMRNQILRDLLEPASPSQLHIAISQRLAMFLISLPPSIELPRDAFQFHQEFESVRSALQAVLNWSQRGSSKPLLRRGSKTARKNARAADNFGDAVARIGRQYPQGPDEATDLAAELRGRLEQIMRAMFTTLRNDEIEEYAREIISNNGSRMETNLTTQAPRVAAVEPPFTLQDELPKTESPDELAFINPEKALQFLDEVASNYGEWPIVIAQRALGHLRKLSNGDGAVFGVVERRIKELSTGLFTRSNQIFLLDKDYGVPLYKAKLPGELCLIYQIDCGAPVANNSPRRFESQFIRVFDICTQVDQRFWSAVAIELGRRSTEYRQRCNFRKRSPTMKGVTHPETFLRNANPDSRDFGGRGIVEQLDENDFLELHRILALEKFIPFSQGFFEALRTRDDSNFVFSVSPHEDDIIKHNSSCLVLGRSGTGKTTTMLFKMVDREIAGTILGAKYRQLFVTQSRTLATRVEAYFLELLDSTLDSRESSKTRKGKQPFTLYDIDDYAEDEGSLPTRFSELTDEHFPLFLTFDQLCKLLEADLTLRFIPSRNHSSSSPLLPTNIPGGRQPLVSYDFFLSELWPRFNERIKKGLNPALVFSEFLGVIKGSETTLLSPTGYLDRATYEGLGVRGQSTFLHNRDRIYSLFEAYQKTRPANAYDAAERSHALLNASKKKPIAAIVDFLYVDEVQDNLVIDTALLRSLCRNPHGLFFAGDTAQTISIGSSFRFTDLKAFMYRLERTETLVKSGARPPTDPEFFELSTNYRSHGGIVNAAAFIVSLLTKFFPTSIDLLSREVAMVPGPRPIFFTGREEDADFHRLMSDKESGKVELGAHQAIIVRTETAAENLRQKIGKSAIVLTLYESKGMEFNDVLLYDFFADSTASPTDWRAMLHALDGTPRPSSGNVGFDERRHAILQSELKCLYVGLTRAREHAWVWDTSDKGSSMEELMANERLSTSHEQTAAVPQLAVSSSTKEWVHRARVFFTKRLFRQAELCFEKAEEHWWTDVCRAYGDRQEAERLPSTHLIRRESFRQVGVAFDIAAQNPPNPQDARLLYVNAAKCFVEAGEHASAALCFLRGDKYNEAVLSYRKAGLFDEAIAIIRSHESLVDQAVSETVKYVAKVVWTKDNQIQKARSLCDGRDDYLDFLKDHSFDSQRILFLNNLALHDKAADVCKQQGDYIQAVHSFLRSNTFASRQKAAACLLEGLRTETPYGTDYHGQNLVARELLRLSFSIPFSDKGQAEITMFRAVYTSRSAVELGELAKGFARQGNVRCAMLAFDSWANLDHPRSLETTTTAADVAAILSTYVEYGRIVRVTARTRNMIGDQELQSLFGLTFASAPISDNADVDQEVVTRVAVPPRCFAYVRAVQTLRPEEREAARSHVTTVHVARPIIEQTLRTALLTRFNSLVFSLHSSAMHSGAFTLCIPFATNGRCRNLDEGKCRLAHPPQSDPIQNFNQCIRIHLLLISVLDYFAAVEGDTGEDRNRRVMQGIWLARLFETCYPGSLELGSIADIAPALIPEYQQVMLVLKAWFQEFYCAQRPSGNPFFLANLVASAMLATALDYENAVKWLRQGQWATDEDQSRSLGLLQPDGRPIAGCAVSWFPRDVAPRHNLGVFFIKYVVGMEPGVFTPRMDIHILVAFAEDVCAQMIMNHYWHRKDYNGMTMPRSWLIRAVARGPSMRSNGSMPYHLLPALEKLMELLLGQHSSGLQINRKPISHLTNGPARGRSLARICRTLALLGYNLHQEGLRHKIVDTFKNIIIPDGFPMAPHHLYRYFESQNWGDVFKALRTAGTSPPLNEMIAIYQGTDHRASVNVQGVGNITWMNSRDLMRKLLLRGHISVLTPSLEAQTSVPHFEEAHRTATSDVRDAPALKLENASEPEPEDEVEDGGQLNQITHTIEQEKAACVFQKYFREHKKRASGGVGGPMYEAFDMAVLALAAKNATREKYSLYFKYLRGPMPHVVEYVQKLADRCQEHITALNRAMAHTQHEGLDDVVAQRTGASLLKNDLRELLRKLQPKSAFHKLCSLEKLVELVRHIPSLSMRVRKFAPDVQDDNYKVGVEWIIAERTDTRSGAERKEKRPVLNTEDL